MPGFGQGAFGSQPFGQWPWSQQVLFDLLPGLYKQQDALNGNVLQTWTQSLRYSFDLMTSLISNWIELRDPLKVRTAYDQVVAITLGENVTPPAPIEQRGVDGSINSAKQFVSPTARFKQPDIGKKLTFFNSGIPINNRTFTVAAVISPTIVVCNPPLVVDPGPIRWQLQGFSPLPANVIAVEVHGGDVSAVAPGWILYDGFSQFEVYERAQFFPLDGQTSVLTVRDGLNGFVQADGTFKCEAAFAQTNVGQPFSVSGSIVSIPNSDFTNNGKYQIYDVSVTDPTVLTFHAPLTIEYVSPEGVPDPYGAVVYTMQNGMSGVQVAHLIYGPSNTLFIIVDSEAINIYLGTDVNSNVTSTPADVVAAVNGFPAAAALVTASLSPAVAALPSGGAASVVSVLAGTATITGLSGMTMSMVGLSLTLSGAASFFNNGTFLILSFISGTSVVVAAPAAVAGDANDGAIAWVVVIPTPHVVVAAPAQTIPGTRLYPEPGPLTWSLLPFPQLQLVASTSPAGITTQQGIDLVLSGSLASAVTAKWSQVDVGNLLVLRGSLLGNDQIYTITKFINVTEVEVFPAVTLSGTTASVTAYVSPLATITGLSGITPALVLSYLSFSGAASSGNNGVFQIITYISPTSVQVENLTGVSGDANNGDILWSIQESGLTWEEHTLTPMGDGTQVSVNASSIIDYLAQDFGITIDQRESEVRQRGWVANLTQWIGFKGTAKGYEIIGDISGFDVEPFALFRVTQPISLSLPDTSLYAVDEVGAGYSGTDGYLTSAFGSVVFTSPSATFVPSDVGLLVQLGNCNAPANNALYTIYNYISPNSVEFAPYNSASTPDYGNGGSAMPLRSFIQWDICRLYSTQPPTQPDFDEVNGELMQSFLGEPHFEVDSYCWQPAFVNHFPASITNVSPNSSNGVPIYYEVTVEGVLVTVPPSGSSAAVISVVGSQATISGLVGIAPGVVGASLTLSGAFSGGNNGTFPIVQYLSPTSLVITNGSAVAGDALNGFISWEVQAYTTMDVVGQAGPWQITDSTSQLFYIEPNASPFQALTLGTGNAALLFQSQISGTTNINVTILSSSSLSVTVTGHSIVITTAASTTAAQVVTALQASPSASALVSVSAGGDGSGIVASAGRTFLQGGVKPVLLVSAGPPSSYSFRVYSSEVPQLGTATVAYNCSVQTSCNYCQASTVLALISEGSIAGESGLAIEEVLNRVIARLEAEVTPAHVRLVPVFTRTLQASLNITAYIVSDIEVYAIMIASEQAYYDILPGDSLAPDIVPVTEGGGSATIASTAPPLATVTGLVGMIPGVVGATLYIADAAVSGNNGRFLITAYISATSVTIRNPAADATDTNNGSLAWLVQSPGLTAEIVTP